MTSHEFDTHCDITGWQPEDDSFLLIEQQRDFYEMEAAKETALKKAGAIEALELVYSRIAKLMWNDPSTSTGLWLAHREIKDALVAIGLAEGGAA